MHKKQVESAKIRKGGLKHMGFAFSGEEASSGIRSMTIVGENKGGKHVGAMEGIEEEKSEDILQMS